jgi:hypothetical protein
MVTGGRICPIIGVGGVVVVAVESAFEDAVVVAAAVPVALATLM